jgi:hypothetical protein
MERLEGEELTQHYGIVTWFHCRQCVEQNLSSDISVGVTDIGIKVVCNNHQQTVVELKSNDELLDMMRERVCDRPGCTHCKHHAVH